MEGASPKPLGPVDVLITEATYAARDLPAGYTIRREDVALKSPGDGLPPYELDKVIGRITRQELKEDEDITYEVLNGAENWAEAAS